jgi:ABC-type Fe3+-siderophore transport system permease subunit
LDLKEGLDEYAFKIGTTRLALYNAYVFYAKYSVLLLEEEVARRLGISISTPRKYRKILE